MRASVEFYRLIGFDIPDESVWQDGDGAHASIKQPNGIDLELDSTALARAYNAGWAESEAGSGRAVLNFRMPSRESVDELFARVTGAGHAASQEPYDTFWGARYAIVKDPDGNAVGFMSESDPERRSAPPSL